MAKAKRPQLDYKNAVYYYASEDPLRSGDDVIPDNTQQEAITSLRQDSEELDTVYMYEIKCIGKYKVNFTLEKLD